MVMTTPRAASTQNWFWMEKMFLSMSWKPTATSPIRQSIRLPAAITVLRLEGSQLSWRWAFNGTRYAAAKAPVMPNPMLLGREPGAKKDMNMHPIVKPIAPRGMSPSSIFLRQMMEAMTPPTTVPPLSHAMRMAADMLNPVPSMGCSWAIWREMSIRAPARNQK